MLTHQDKCQLIDELIKKDSSATVANYLSEVKEIEAEILQISNSQS